ncbi:MAG: hypothetical protein ABEL97_10150 [Salinibacter sp.]
MTLARFFLRADVRLPVMAVAVHLLIGGVPCLAQSAYDLFGTARADALANATTARPTAVGVQANPAARAALERPTAVFYARQGFGLAALRYGAAHVAVPFRWGTASVGASTFGVEAYREVHLSTGVARGFQFGTARSLRLGATLRYHHTSIAGYGSAGALALNLGLGVVLLRSLHLGVMATNVSGSALGADVPLPRTLAVGLYYQALPHVIVVADIFKDVRFPATVRGGLEVQPVAPLFLRAGVTTAPVRFSGGAGVRLGPLSAQVAAEQHQALGWSPSASLRIRW